MIVAYGFQLGHAGVIMILLGKPMKNNSMYVLTLAAIFLTACDSEGSASKEKEISETFTTAADTRLWKDPCDTGSRTITIPANTDVQASKETFVFGGIAGFPWYYVDYNNNTGWISSQSVKNAPELVIDKKNVGKCKVGWPTQ